uniref:Scaffolding anchor of CK1 domain-containing protein n=1 Tax=Malurus cyaneus samueli TaxID=2593467 RepID=A0A8C5TPG3_9PASS
MAFSQVQCLDDSHVNWRSSESKPEFFYSEEQRLALEALASRGPDAFYEVLKRENIRDFLSELELKKILDTLEAYDPGSEYIPRHGSSAGDSEGDRNSQGDEQDVAPSLEYWPQRSDRSIPQLDLGWPETIAYRGVTRATVYMQPPIEGQAHIKEVVRKMICQAQKVRSCAAGTGQGWPRGVLLKVLLREAFLEGWAMSSQQPLTPAHASAFALQNLRVRSTGGTEFFTRSATKFKGALAQKFMFVDGDRAMCGSYSFTWSAARTDRNVITVLSGQVVEAFDKQFQELYLMSKGVSLKSISVGEEPEPEPVTLPSVVPVTPANAVVKKLINPKYALVKAKSGVILCFGVIPACGVVLGAEITLPTQENHTLHVATVAVTQEVTKEVVAVLQLLVSSNGAAVQGEGLVIKDYPTGLGMEPAAPGTAAQMCRDWLSSSRSGITPSQGQAVRAGVPVPGVFASKGKRSDTSLGRARERRNRDSNLCGRVPPSAALWLIHG